MLELLGRHYTNFGGLVVILTGAFNLVCYRHYAGFNSTNIANVDLLLSLVGNHLVYVVGIKIFYRE